MRKKFNPDQEGKSNAGGDEPELSKHSTGNYTQFLFEFSYPDGLMDEVEKPALPLKSTVVEMSTLHDSLFDTLPDFLKKVVAQSASKEERDILLLGALTTLSASLPTIHGYYDTFKVYPNLFLFVTGNSSAGKGRLSLCKLLVEPIHEALKEQTKEMKRRYKMEINELNQAKGDEPIKISVIPPEKMLLISPRSNSTRITRILADNDRGGLIFETEGDCLAKALKTEYSNYTNILRKGFHHEFISYYRLARSEYREVNSPRLSLVLAGTIKQLTNLVPCTENGLFSRLMFYSMNTRPEWKDVFSPKRERSLDDEFDDLGQEYLNFYNELNKHPEMTFGVTSAQADQFNAFFSQLQDRYLIIQDKGFIATIRRLGIIAFRMSMIFTALRIMETGDFSQKKEPLDVDFQASLSIVRILVRHASHVYSQLPDQVMPARKK